MLSYTCNLLANNLTYVCLLTADPAAISSSALPLTTPNRQPEMPAAITVTATATVPQALAVMQQQPAEEAKLKQKQAQEAQLGGSQANELPAVERNDNALDKPLQSEQQDKPDTESADQIKEDAALNTEFINNIASANAADAAELRDGGHGGYGGFGRGGYGGFGGYGRGYGRGMLSYHASYVVT